MYEREILEVYETCKIKSFPIDCIQVFRSLGYQVITYEQESKGFCEKFAELTSISPDGFVIPAKSIVMINNRQYRKRQVFTLAHELGHIVMVSKDEDVANEFASNFLAPRPIIFSRQLKTADEIAQTFGISIAAANNALIRKRYEPDDDDYAIIDWFYERWKLPWPYNQKPLGEEPVKLDCSVKNLLYGHIHWTQEKEDNLKQKITNLEKEMRKTRRDLKMPFDEWMKNRRKLEHEIREANFDLNLLRKAK